MEIEIKNFGPIDYLKFDLNKDLHLIYGKNAIGKSYATYCIYCVLKNIKDKTIPDTFAYKELLEYIHELLIPIFSSLEQKKTIDITNELNNLISFQLKKILLNGIQNSILNSFSSIKNLQNKYSNKNFEIILTLASSEKLIFYSNNEETLNFKFVNIPIKLQIVLTNKKTNKYSLYENDKFVYGSQDEKIIDLFHEYLMNKVIQILKYLFYCINEIYYLPASRSGLYQALSAFTPIIAELTKNRFFMKNKSIELPSLSEPLADYFIDLSTVDKNHINAEFDNIIELLQKNILKGEVEYNDQTKKIIYTPNDIDIQLNLSEASSMVSELSPLVLYFRHILKNKYTSDYNKFENLIFELAKEKLAEEKSNDILFIEEPEAHLHPEVQVKLMEIFAMLPVLGIKVFITSHSNYMFNKLNNLLIKKEINKDKVMVYHLVKGKNGTIANDDMVVTEDGINDENFQDVSEQLYFERLNYLEAKNDTKD